MAKPSATFVCQTCGATYSKWSGRCEACGDWNSIVEQAPRATGAKRSSAVNRGMELSDLATKTAPPARRPLGIEEFDRVLGGGIVPGSAILVGGDPGIGKSTLLLQAAARHAAAGLTTLYVSGEEAADQVRLRAARLGLTDAPVKLAAETSLDNILTTLGSDPPGLVIVDSIQTMWTDTAGASPGSVGQVRATAHELTAFAKRTGTAVVLVGHVTKEGQIAGPRVVEHMVDTVMYFEGERGHAYRILRAVKNRFGATGEIGVFEMRGDGLAEVQNPSELFLGDRDRPSPGSAVFAGIEGSRPVLVEIQALVAPTPHSQPRRQAVGWDGGRLAMILAVLESRCAVPFAGLDVYLAAAGGMRVREPAADLAVALALVSAREDAALPAGTVTFGEIALSGGLRQAGQSELRLKEAAKLGFSRAIAPARTGALASDGVEIATYPDLPALIGATFGAG